MSYPRTSILILEQFWKGEAGSQQDRVGLSWSDSNDQSPDRGDLEGHQEQGC